MPEFSQKESSIRESPTISPATSNNLEAVSPEPPKSNRPAEVSAPADSDRKQKRREAFLAANVPINFWGKVVDQKGFPLPGVTVIADTSTFIIAPDGSPITAYPKTNVVTGADGLFEILGMTGDSLQLLALDREGYEAEPGALRVFGYNLSENVSVSRDNPIVFRLWQKGPKESLITGSKSVKIVPDGRPYAVNLMDGTITEAHGTEGDLQVWAKRPDGVQPDQKYFAWEFGIKTQNGGILRDLDGHDAMYLAPTTGYTNEYRYTQPATNDGWGSGSGRQRFYVTFRGGQHYGRIQIDVDTCFRGEIPGFSRGDGRLVLDCTINPSGSPVLR